MLFYLSSAKIQENVFIFHKSINGKMSFILVQYVVTCGGDIQSEILQKCLSGVICRDSQAVLSYLAYVAKSVVSYK